MRKLIILTAVSCLAWITPIQAQNRRQGQTKGTSARMAPKTTSAKPIIDKEMASYRQKRDSLEALRDDLKRRWENINGKETNPDVNGNEFQVAYAVLKGNEINVFLRVRNMQKLVTLNFHSRHITQPIHSTVLLRNGDDEKRERGESYVYVEKGYWQVFKLFTLYDIKLLPKPKTIKTLRIDEENFSSPIEFNDIHITTNE